jgi:DNA polymerase elongation subunit (family B)
MESAYTQFQMNRIYWDIETGPKDIEFIKKIMGEFNPANVKIGKNKKPEAVAKQIEDARLAYEPDLLDSACLNAIIGRVMAIGYIDLAGEAHILDADADEATAIDRWFHYMARHKDALFLGWNTVEFDLRFLRQRALCLGLKIPYGLYIHTGYRPRWSRNVDLMFEFTGSTQQYKKLDHVAKALGHTGKNGDGAMFHKLWTSKVPGDRERAGMYLTNDLQMTKFVGDKIVDLHEYVPQEEQGDDVPY